MCRMVFFRLNAISLMHVGRFHCTESQYNFNDFWRNFIWVSGLVKPKYAMLSESIRHWPLTIAYKFRLIKLEISVPGSLIEDSIGRVIYIVVDVYRQSALSLINERNPEHHIKISLCRRQLTLLYTLIAQLIKSETLWNFFLSVWFILFEYPCYHIAFEMNDFVKL